MSSSRTDSSLTPTVQIHPFLPTVAIAALGAKRQHLDQPRLEDASLDEFKRVRDHIRS